MPSYPTSPLFILPMIVIAASALAGTIDNRSNHSAAYIRHLSRSSDARQPDAVAYDPAGTAFMGPGWHFEVDNQTLSKYNRNSRPEFSFTSDLVSPTLPTVFAVLQRQNWSAFASGTLVGGGGNLHYDKGTVTVLPLVAALSTANPATAPDLQLSSLYWAATLGGAYAVKPWLSLSFAGRWIIASTRIRGEVRGDRVIDHEETANFPTVMLGAHFKPVEGLDIGLRYENIAKLEWEVQKSNLDLTEAMNPTAAAGYEALLRGTLRKKGETFNHDLPPVAALGIGYTFNPYFRVDISETFYWQTVADWEGKQDKVDNGYESAIGLEVSPIPGKWSLSAGALSTISGADPETYFIESPALDGYTLAGGTRWQANPVLAIDLGVAYSGTYDDHANHATLGTIDLKKHTWVYGVSLGFHLP